MRGKNWFASAGRRRNFKRAFGHLRRKPVSYLEIGVFRADSFTWMLKNILTHEDAVAIGVDPWRAECMGRPWTQDECDENYELSKAAVAPYGMRATLYRQPSASWFEVCGPAMVNGLDAIYLDGMHDYDPLKADFLAAWPLLKVGGTLVIDDLGARTSKIPALLADLEVEYASRWEELFRNYQFGCRKLS